MGNGGRGWLLGCLGLILLVVTGCADDGDSYVAGTGLVATGLVGIVDHPAQVETAPALTVHYLLPWSHEAQSLRIFSEQPAGGDILFDPVMQTHLITQGPQTLMFGVDSADPHRATLRAFLNFPLDGATGAPVLPLEAIILSATLNLRVDFIDFALHVPVRVDLVRYSVIRGLDAADYASAPLAATTFELLDFDAGKTVLVDVSGLMQEVQERGLADFQVRFALIYE